MLSPEHSAIAEAARRALSAAEAVRDLVEVGAYAPGSNTDADHGLAVSPGILELCRQQINEVSAIDATFAALGALLAANAFQQPTTSQIGAA